MQLRLVHPHFSTADISLAAYLHSQGHQFSHLDKSDFPTLFYFVNTPELTKAVSIFEAGKTPEVQYYRSYKLMIDKLKDDGNKKKGNR